MKISCIKGANDTFAFLLLLFVGNVKAFVGRPQLRPRFDTMTTSNSAASSLLQLQSVPSNDDDGDGGALLLEQVLQVAILASKKAGDIILGNAGGAPVTERKANSRDLLTLIDPLCEKVRTCIGGCDRFCFCAV